MRGLPNNHLVCACIAALGILLSAMALAADGAPDYVAEYRAYNEALEAGDRAAAATHALAAWEAAEQALGDHKTIAVLAYNYGPLVLFSNPEAALPALTRAQDLLEAGIPELPAADLEMFIAYAKFKVKGETSPQARRLRKALNALAASGAPPTYESSLGWLELAINDATNKRYDDAVESAAYAEASIVEAIPGEYRLRASAIMVSAWARIAPLPRKSEVIYEAHEEFVRGANLFPPQKDIDNFDPIFAKLIAWEAAARAALASKRRSSLNKVKGFTKDWSDYGLIIDKGFDDEDCAGDWEERTTLDYPKAALRKGYIGAAIIGFNIASDGQVVDQRILAEVPTDVFGKVSLKATQGWRRELPLDPRPGCQTNMVTTFTYVLD